MLTICKPNAVTINAKVQNIYFILLFCTFISFAFDDSYRLLCLPFAFPYQTRRQMILDDCRIGIRNALATCIRTHTINKLFARQHKVAYQFARKTKFIINTMTETCTNKNEAGKLRIERAATERDTKNRFA